MRAGMSTDDYILIDGEMWTVVDTGAGQRIFCGLCTGWGTYPLRIEDIRRYPTVMELRGGRLFVARGRRKYWFPWSRHLDAFAADAGLGDEIPYTGWLLACRGAFAWNLESVVLCGRVMELRFDGGALVESWDISEGVAAVREGLPDGLGSRDVAWSHRYDKALSEAIRAALAPVLHGEYNCTARADGLVSKELDEETRGRPVECACVTCRRLRAAGIPPVHLPKRPRKRKYRHPRPQLGKDMPEWVCELAEEAWRRSLPDGWDDGEGGADEGGTRCRCS